MFIEIKAGIKSISNRKLLHGFGVNDSDYMIRGYDKKGNRTACPYYIKWANMIDRCYSVRFQKSSPTYRGCSVTSDWLTFSNFKRWMIAQDWKGKELDKDLLTQGNKVYGKHTCIFVSRQINSLLTSCKASRGAYPQGVHFSKNTNNYRAVIRENGKHRHIGLFETPEMAHKAYKAAKYKLIADIASKQTEPLKSALLNYKISEY